MLYCLEMQVPLISLGKEPEKANKTMESGTYQILETQLAMLYNVNENKDKNETQVENQDVQEEAQNEEIQEEQEDIIQVAENVETKVISENNITASYTNSGNNVEVKNQSSYDIQELIENANYELKNKEKVIIYHTHTCESYTPSEKYGYEMTGTYRTTNLGYSVARVR